MTCKENFYFLILLPGKELYYLDLRTIQYWYRYTILYWKSSELLAYCKHCTGRSDISRYRPRAWLIRSY